MTEVAIAKAEHRRETVKRVLNALPKTAWDGIVTAEPVLIKPNLVHHKKQLASSHIDAVRAVLDVVREKTDTTVIVADASYHGTKAAFRNFGYEHLPDEYDDVHLVDLNEDDTVSGYYIKRDGSKGEMGISKTVSTSAFTICLAQMKTHRDTGVTLTTKNWTIGTWVPTPRHGVNGKYWPRWPYLHEEGAYAHNATIAELLDQMAPNLAVIDGFVAMEGDGPTRGTPVELGAAVAGTDCIAVDATACRLMHIPPTDIGYLVMANERGYGTLRKEQISLLGMRDLHALAKPFRRPNAWDHVTAWRE